MNEIKICEICQSEKLETVLDLGNHPLCDDLIEIGSDKICKEYPIEILYCNNCYTAHQKYQVQKEVLFPDKYHYRSRFTKDVLNGMESLVKECKKQFGELKGKVIIDIGCNDGSLLNFFKKEGALTIGIEPTEACDYAKLEGHYVLKEYFTEKLAKDIILQFKSIDIITFTNVFAHIEDLQSLLKAVKILCNENTKVIIENHYLGAILEKYQFDTFYHEHPRTYSYKSFKIIAEQLGLSILECQFPSRYGGNIRLFMGNGMKNFTGEAELLQKEANFFSEFIKLREIIKIWQKKERKLLLDLQKKYGPLKAKAFPGRAAILLKLLDLNESVISGVYEKPNSMKIGHYVPGTRMEIKSDVELFSEDTSKPILNLAWHISDEIEDYLRSNEYEGEIFQILNPYEL